MSAAAQVARRILAPESSTAAALAALVPASAPPNDQRRLKAECDAYLARERAGRRRS